MAIEAGCDGALICSGDHATQAAALEALIHAVEQERIPYGRVEDALKRQRRAKERFLDVAGRRQARRRAGAARRARPRRAPRDRRGDGALPVMRKPRALAPGDRLAIVAPASPFTREEFDSGLQEIRRLGFVPVYDDSVFARQRYVAGSAAVRAAAIHAAWRDPSIAGVIGVRGGYGSAQLLPLLDREAARRASKPFIGYSDLTSMLTFLTLGCDQRRVSRSDAGGPAGARRGRLRRRLVRQDAVPARAAGRARPSRARIHTVRGGRRYAARRHADAAARVARRRRSPSRRPPATSCFSTKWASARTASIAWSRSWRRPGCWRARRPS